MKHKHCEVIKAWADGKDIQYQESDGRWHDVKSSCPGFYKQDKYRVKPETVTLRYRHFISCGTNGLVSIGILNEGMMLVSSLEGMSFFKGWISDDWQEVSV